MKNIFVILFFLSSFTLIYATKFKIIDETKIQTIIDVQKSKKEIFSKLKDWIAKNFDDSSSIIKVANEDCIEGLGNYILPYDNSQTGNKFFTYKFEIKDNKIRITISDFYMKTISTLGETAYYYKSHIRMQKMINAINKKSLIENIVNFVDDIKTKDDNW